MGAPRRFEHIASVTPMHSDLATDQVPSSSGSTYAIGDDRAIRDSAHAVVREAVKACPRGRKVRIRIEIIEEDDTDD